MQRRNEGPVRVLVGVESSFEGVERCEIKRRSQKSVSVNPKSCRLLLGGGDFNLVLCPLLLSIIRYIY